MRPQTQPGEKHLTASVYLVTTETPKRVLLIHHVKFNKWIAPGGHVEPDENPYHAAIREVREETGIDISPLMPPPQVVDVHSTFLPLPNYFIEETIPAYGDTPAHFHLDNVYVVEVPMSDVTHDPNEAHAVGWFTLEESDTLETFDDVHRSLKELLR